MDGSHDPGWLTGRGAHRGVDGLVSTSAGLFAVLGNPLIAQGLEPETLEHVGSSVPFYFEGPLQRDVNRVETSRGIVVSYSSHQGGWVGATDGRDVSLTLLALPSSRCASIGGDGSMPFLVRDEPSVRPMRRARTSNLALLAALSCGFASGARAQATIGESIGLTTDEPRVLSASSARVATDGSRYLAAWLTHEGIVYVTQLDAAGRTLLTPRATRARCGSIGLAWSGSHWLLACAGPEAPTVVLRLAPDGTGGETAATFPAGPSTPSAQLSCGPSRCALAIGTEDVLAVDLASDGTPLGELPTVASGARRGESDVCVGASYTLVLHYEEGRSAVSAVRRGHAGGADVALDVELGRAARCAARGDVFAMIGQTHVVFLEPDGSLGAPRPLGVPVSDAVIAPLSDGWMITLREPIGSGTEWPLFARTVDAAGMLGPGHRLSTSTPLVGAPSLACTSASCVSVFASGEAGAYARAHGASGAEGAAEQPFSNGVPAARDLRVVSNGCEATLLWSDRASGGAPTLMADLDVRAPLPDVVAGERASLRVPAARGPSATLWQALDAGAGVVFWSVEHAGALVGLDEPGLGGGAPLVLGDGFAVLHSYGVRRSETTAWEIRELGGEFLAEPRSRSDRPLETWSRSGSTVAFILGPRPASMPGPPPPPPWEIVYMQPGASVLGPFPADADMPMPRAIACRESRCLLADATEAGITIAHAVVGEAPGPARTISLIDDRHWRPLELIAVGAGYLLALGDHLIALDANGEEIGPPVELPARGELFALDPSRVLVSSTAGPEAALRAHVVTIGSMGAAPRCDDAQSDAGVTLDAGASPSAASSCVCRATGGSAPWGLGGFGWGVAALLLVGVARRRR